MEIKEKIKALAKDLFEIDAVEAFLKKFDELSAGVDIVDSILQISTDEGDELEIGFFTSEVIVDITLSQGKVYSCVYPISKVKELHLSEEKSKWVLTIIGEKKFDYNIVKPGSNERLRQCKKASIPSGEHPQKDLMLV